MVFKFSFAETTREREVKETVKNSWGPILVVYAAEAFPEVSTCFRL